MTNHAVSNRADLRERTKTMSRHGDRRGQIADFRDSFETINWLYLLFKCGKKTKTHFEWLLWHWSSLGQLNLEPTQPNGLVGCKVPTDLVKISVKEATHMGFHYITQWGRDKMAAILHIVSSNVFSWMKMYECGIFCTSMCHNMSIIPVSWYYSIVSTRWSLSGLVCVISRAYSVCHPGRLHA